MLNTARPRRSVLYMPGSNTRALEKARGLPADSLILDLEDAVAADAKAEARTNIMQAVEQGGYGYRELVVRINPLLKIGSLIFRTVVMAGLAALVVIFWPAATDRVSQAVVAQPLAAGGLGLLTLICGPFLLLILLITLILSPLTLVGVVALVVAAAFGWIAIGAEIGTRFAQALNWELQPAVNAAIGAFLLTAARSRVC